jgi:hypothetical protein
MLAYTNTELSKSEVLARVRAHREADMIRFGDGDHCAVSCTVGSYDHLRCPALIGVPVELARLEDAIFEGFGRTGQRELGLAWPERFLDAIPEGADLSMVWPRWALWMLRGLDDRGRKGIRAAIDGVIVLYAEWVENGIRPEIERFQAAAYAVDAIHAAADAAYAATYAAYTDAVDVDAADVADYAAEAAADVAAYWRRAADELARLLAAAGEEAHT